MSLFSKLRCALTLGQGVLVSLPEPTGDEPPFKLFDQWFDAAKKCGIVLPESMLVSTATKEAIPSARVVLLKEVDEQGFVFYTNYGSRKAGELDANPHASLTFHWNILQRQVRIEGRVERVSYEQSNAYFQSRGRGSRIGAWASHQSHPIDSRKSLEQQVQHFQEHFKDKEVPCPEFWGGYRVVPLVIEFWQGKADRLHDRYVYSRTDEHDNWHVTRLSP
ncbi:pyridoxamine 5'-phosphate oxidase [Celerinatantimonas sp. MCCC 1A17872]|uniref:pyridoxamine 5'-phosphate oxidase n=1 Tax=Celerinatantimonas sp. MCCC 1A17872 TaxID=3177514 RepID=UPI0038CA18C5